MRNRPDSAFKRILFVHSGDALDPRQRHLIRLLGEVAETTDVPTRSASRSLREIPAPLRAATLVWISGIRSARCLEAARRLGFRVVFDEVAPASLVSRSDKRLSALWRWLPQVRAAHEAYLEERFAAAADAVVTGTEADARRLRRAVPNCSIHLVPAWIDGLINEEGRPAWDLSSRPSSIEAEGPLRVEVLPDLSQPGDEHALRWVLRELAPRLLAHAHGPQARLQISLARSAPGPLGRALERARSRGQIELAHRAGSGARDDRGPDAAIAPVFTQGGDHRLRILQSIAAGSPVVATGVALGGLILQPGHEIVIAEKPDSFATGLLRLLREPSYRDQVARQALAAAERYDWRFARAAIRELLEGLARRG